MIETDENHTYVQTTKRERTEVMVITARNRVFNATDDAAQISSKKEVSEQKSTVKRYNLALPSSLFDEVYALAKDERVSVLELLKRLIKIGLVVTKVTQSSDAHIIIRQGDRERELVLL